MQFLLIFYGIEVLQVEKQVKVYFRRSYKLNIPMLYHRLTLSLYHFFFSSWINKVCAVKNEIVIIHRTSAPVNVEYNFFFPSHGFKSRKPQVWQYKLQQTLIICAWRWLSVKHVLERIQYHLLTLLDFDRLLWCYLHLSYTIDAIQFDLVRSLYSVAASVVIAEPLVTSLIVTRFSICIFHRSVHHRFHCPRTNPLKCSSSLEHCFYAIDRCISFGNCSISVAFFQQ